MRDLRLSRARLAHRHLPLDAVLVEQSQGSVHSLGGGRMPKLGNTEMRPTSRLLSVLFWLGLGGLTFVLLVLGYGVGFWQFPG